MGDRQVHGRGDVSPQAGPSRQHIDGAQAASPAEQQHDIPSVRDLRRDYSVEREVNRRLAELDMDDEVLGPQRQGTRRARGKRSGVARTIQDKVVRDIDWPHFHIYAQPGAEPMTYERLSIQEFTFGFMQMVDQPDAAFDRQIMWELLKTLMEDATEYPWENVKNFFGVVGSHVENDRMEWSDTDSIAKLRVKHLQKHEVVSVTPVAAAPRTKFAIAGPTRGEPALRELITPVYGTSVLIATGSSRLHTHIPRQNAGEKTWGSSQKTRKGGSNRIPPSMQQRWSG